MPSDPPTLSTDALIEIDHVTFGYDTSRRKAPLFGGAHTLVNAMAAHDLRLRHRHRLRFQVNVDNLFDEDALLVTDADQIRAYRYVFQTPRRWSVTSTLTF